MHTKRIIPCLDVHNGRVVKGVNFVNLQDAGDPVEIGEAYDKAGADEHWKTANSALGRIRTVFGSKTDTVFIGAAIEANMANEIFNQLQDGQLTNAANLNNDAQLYNVVNWIIRK